MESIKPLSNNKNNINETMLNIIKTIEKLKSQRDKLNQDIETGYQLKEKIEQQLHLYAEQMQKLADNLEKKQLILNNYDKILNESDSAYLKIVQSAQALLNMVKNEENKFEMKNK